MKSTHLHRSDWKIIEEFVTPGAKVLDLGCGDGSLLTQLKTNKGIHGRGVEIDQENILACIQKGISVFHSDLDEGLSDYADQSFDIVILSLTLQVVYEPMMLLEEMLRVGKKVIVSIPNFGHWRLRVGIFFSGEAPKASHLPYDWYDTPNIRTITPRDFRRFCDKMGIEVEASAHTTITRNGIFSVLASLKPNLFSEVSVYLLSRMPESLAEDSEQAS